MRQLFSFGFIALFVWQIVGFTLYFEYSHHNLKKEIKLLIKEGVSKDNLVIFELTKSQMKDLVWLKENEFDKNGDLFDVVRRFQKENSVTHLECISDKQEKILFEDLNKRVASNLGDENNPTPVTNWMKILTSPSIIPNHLVEFQEFSLVVRAEHVFHYLENNSSKSIKIHSPPPETA